MTDRSLHARLRSLAVLLWAAALTAGASAQQPGTVKAQTKLGSGLGGFTGELSFGDQFGISVSVLDDLDGDGVRDLAIGANGDDGDDSDLNDDFGAVWIVLLAADGTASAQQRLSALEGGFGGALEPRDWFGYSVQGLGDVDGDGTYDLLAGAGGDDDGGNGRGAAWLLGLGADGTALNQRKISATQGGFGGHLANLDAFGFASADLGDLDGDGHADFAIGHVFNDNGGFDSGGLYTIFTDGSGWVSRQREIANGLGGFGGHLDPLDELGRSLCALGDLDGDGVTDLASGAFGDGDGAPNAGSVWILFMKPDGSVRDQQKISALHGGFGGALDQGSRFGSAVAPLGDLDADGVIDLAVGASRGPLFALGTSRVFVLFMNRDGTVKDQLEIGQGLGGFVGQIKHGDRFGTSLHALGDLDGDGVTDLAVGANGDDEGGLDRGAVHILFLNGRPTLQWSLTWPGTPGSLGEPVLSGDGLAVAGTPTALHLRQGPPGGSAYLLAGFTPLKTFFKGGWLYTTPDVLLPGLPLDGTGALNLRFVWPAGVPLGFPIHIQAWLPDPGAPEGFAGSNGLTVIADG